MDIHVEFISYNTFWKLYRRW